MIVTLSGVTGTGKSFFKKAIANELDFEQLVIVTTREKRKDEVNGIDKYFVKDEEFENLKNQGKTLVNFEFLGFKYGYRKVDLESDKNRVTEVQYNTIYQFKECSKNTFSIYIIPSNIEKAKLELKKRRLPKDVELSRLKEIDDHIIKFKSDKELQKQFDYIFLNDYTEKSKDKLLGIVKEKLRREVNI